MGGGSVACWGSDYYGQATPPAGSFVSVSAGWDHTCGVRSDGSVTCWGWNESGRSTPPAGSFVSVSAGGFHTCGIRSDGSVACWGSDAAGLSTPPAGSFTSVSAGSHHTCGVRSDGSVACWGSDAAGQATSPAGSFVSASAGGNHTCGLRSDGSVVCWGSNFDGEATPPAGSFVSVSAGNQHTCGLRSDGSVACWGTDEYGQATPPAGSFVSVSAGNQHTCGLRSDGSVACWGSDEYGQSTPAVASFSPTPSAAAPTPAPTPETEPTTPTATPTSAPTPTPAPAAATLSLDEYLTHCAPPDSELGDDATYGDLSSELAAEADRLEALTPPAQLSEWHLLNIENFRTIQADLDTYPKDDVIDFAIFIGILRAYAELQEKLGEVAARLPEDVRQQMVEAGCVEDLPDNYEAVPDDHGNNLESATGIAIGETVGIELEDLGDEDVIVFRLAPDREYVFTLDVDSYVEWADAADPLMTLFDVGGQELARLEEYDLGQNKITWQAATGGDYYIVVGGGSRAGSFTLTVTEGGAAEPLNRDDHGNSEGEATAIRVGADARGALDYEGDIDFFRFQAERGQSYVVSLPQWSFSRSGTLPDSDAKTITLYDSAARQLASANLSSSPYGIAWAALNSEYIYIAIGEDGTYGSYTLTVAPDDHGHDPSTATSIAMGESVAFTLYGNDTDYLRFQAEAGQDYRVDIESLTSVWGMPRVAIHDSSGLELASFGLDEEIIVESPGSGDYYIAATMEPEGFGEFTLLVFSSEDDHADSVEGATIVEVGEPVRGVVYPEDDPDFFVFQAESGKSYEIGVAGNLYDARIDLFDSNEALLESFGSRAVWKTERAGEYYIEVTDYGSPSSYTLSVSVLEITDDHGGSAADASAVTVGESIEGAVNYLGDEDVFLFQVEAGAIYEIEVAPGTLADFDLGVYDEPDEWKGRSFSPVLSVETHRNVWRSEYTGDSYLVVGFPGFELGSYTVRVARITLAGNTSYDTDRDGLIEVSSLMQLNAVRWDLDGDGLPDSSSGIAGFAAAFPGALDGMGCPDSECSGYELISDLDFDTNGNGRADAGDDYWNDGEGWAPIGDDFGVAFESFFDGGGHTISNLYIDRRDAEYVGLFGNTGHSGSNYFVGLNNNIRDLALVNVDVQGGSDTGGLVGSNGLVIAACSVTGVVSGGGSVGGLVGNNFSGTVIASYSTASVAGGPRTGGLVGSNFSGTIIASYSIGSVSNDFGDVGGLVGSNFADRGTTRDSYWDTQTSGQSESDGGEGKTTSELQSPTGYTGIYENWNLDLDEDGVGDDLWDFGDANQYPRLRHGS